MLTDSDIDRLEKRFEKKFATKEDLKNFATKDDLKGFATKDDLKGFATKEDLKGFATKEDLKGFATKEDLCSLKGEISTLRHDIRRVEGSLWLKFELLNRDLVKFHKEFTEFKDNVYGHLDGFVGTIKRIDEEHIGLSHSYTELRDRVDELSKTS